MQVSRRCAHTRALRACAHVCAHRCVRALRVVCDEESVQPMRASRACVFEHVRVCVCVFVHGLQSAQAVRARVFFLCAGACVYVRARACMCVLVSVHACV